MAGNKIGMQMGLDDVLNAQAVLGGFLQIEVDVALRIDHGPHAVRANHVRRMRQATQIKLLEIHSDNSITPGTSVVLPVSDTRRYTDVPVAEIEQCTLTAATDLVADLRQKCAQDFLPEEAP